MKPLQRNDVAWILAAALLLDCDDRSTHGSRGDTATSSSTASASSSSSALDPDATFAVAVAAAPSITLVLMKNGDIWGFGDNADGECPGRWLNLPVPERCDASDMSSIFVANGAAGGIRSEGVPVIWGRELSEQLGDGPGRNTPRDGAHVLDQLVDVIDFHATSFAWAAQRDGAIYEWGVGQTSPNGVPQSVYVPTRYDALPAGTVRVRGHATVCALTQSGDLYTWGWNQAGNVGDGTTVDSFATIPAEPVLRGVQTVPECNRTNCVVVDGGDVYCWGAGKYGQMGDGRSGLDLMGQLAPIQTTPTRVVALPPIVGLAYSAAWDQDICAWTATGDVYCWGYNLADQFGLGDSPVTRPRRLPQISDVVDVALGVEQAAFVKRDGTVWTQGLPFLSEVGRENREEAFGQVFFVR